MKQLSKTECQERDKHVADLQSAKEALEQAIETFNSGLAELFAPVKAAVEAYNDKIDTADGWRDDIHNTQEEYLGEKSDTWQEGDRGQAYSSWADEWDNSLEPIELEPPADLEVPEMDHSDTLANLPEAPE